MIDKKDEFPSYRSPDGEIFTCIFFATKTPPGIEWYGFRIEKKDDNKIVFYGLVDSNLNKELAYFSLCDIIEIGGDFTFAPDVIKQIGLPGGWEKFEPASICC